MLFRGDMWFSWCSILSLLLSIYHVQSQPPRDELPVLPPGVAAIPVQQDRTIEKIYFKKLGTIVLPQEATDWSLCCWQGQFPRGCGLPRGERMNENAFFPAVFKSPYGESLGCTQ
jgi:hypothetical protein